MKSIKQLYEVQNVALLNKQALESGTLPKIGDSVKIKVLEGRNKSYNGKTFDLGKVKSIGVYNYLFFDEITLGDKKYAPRMSINTNNGNAIEVWLSPVGTNRGGITFDNVEIIK